MSKELENAWAVQEIWQDKCYKLEEENKKLKEKRDFFKEQAILWRNDYKNEYEENRKLKYIIDTIMEKTCIDHITLASGEVFLNPSKRLKTSLEK